jgi:predicted dehydrogenase
MTFGDRPIRVGLIGAGKHGRRYATHICKDFQDRLRLVALARNDAAKAAETAREFGCRAYVGYRALIEEADVDALIVVVPPVAHPEMLSAAACAGRAVLLEKPAAIDLRAGRMLIEALAVHPVPVMVAQTLRYNTVIRTLLGHCAEIGPIHSLALTQRFEMSRLEWIDDPSRSGGGMILHTGVHSFDLLRMLTGMEADRVTCQFGSVRTSRTEDNFAATVSLGGGAVLAVVSGSRAAGGRTGYIEVAGEHGTLVGDHVGHRLHKVVGTTATPIPLGDPVPTVREVLRDFERALRTNALMPIPLKEGLRAVAVADACYAAARSGSTVAVEAIV